MNSREELLSIKIVFTETLVMRNSKMSPIRPCPNCSPAVTPWRQLTSIVTETWIYLLDLEVYRVSIR